MKSILDRSFQYTPAAQTDLRKTFARLRREQKEKDKVAAHAVNYGEGVLKMQALKRKEKP